MRETTEKIKDQDRHMCAAQAARMLDALRDLYADTDETDPATLLTYALCDLRHVADLELTKAFSGNNVSCGAAIAFEPQAQGSECGINRTGKRSSFAACDRSGYQLYLQELHGAG
jgi:hypothetical protein